MRSSYVEESLRTSPRLVSFQIGFLVGSFLAANLLRVALMCYEDKVVTVLLNVAQCSTNDTALHELSLTTDLVNTACITP